MAVSSPPPADFPWAIFIAATGVAVNFVFNVVNYRRTSGLKKKDVRLDEFKRYRARLDTAISEIRADQTSLRGQSNSAVAQDLWIENLKVLNLRLVENFGKLDTTLHEMDVSPFVSGADWKLSPQTLWDSIVQSIDGGYNTTKTRAQQQASVSDAAAKLGQMLDLLGARINKEMESYASLKA